MAASEQRYIVTTRGRNRQYGILATVAGPHDGDFHKAAHEKARLLSPEIRSYESDISAFAVGAEKVEKWSQLQAEFEKAESAQDWQRAREVRAAQHKFLDALT